MVHLQAGPETFASTRKSATRSRPCQPLRRPVKHCQLAHSYRFDVGPLLDTPAFKQALRVFALEAQGHTTYGNAALQYRRASLMFANVLFFHRVSSLV